MRFRRLGACIFAVTPFCLLLAGRTPDKKIDYAVDIAPIFKAHCNSCHSGEASARGPNLAQVYGSRLQLSDGSTVTATDAYLREAILNPSTKVTAGYAPIMPTYQGQVSEEGLIDLVEYIKNLNSNYRIQQTLTTSQLSTGQAGASTSGSGSNSPAMSGPAKAGRTAPSVPGTVNQ